MSNFLFRGKGFGEGNLEEVVALFISKDVGKGSSGKQW